jgi:hypothetical protein
MHRWKKSAIILPIILVMALTSAGFHAVAGEGEPFEEGSPEAMASDLIFIRPAGLVTTVVGAVFYVASLPFSLPGRNGKAAFRRLVGEPAVYTFYRPLGEFER